MKKVMSIVIAILVAAALAAGAFAEAMPDDAVVESPTMSSDLVIPEVVGAVAYDEEGEVIDVDVTEEIIISMGEEGEYTDIIELAYESLETAGSVEAVCEELAGMEVRDLIYIDATDRIAELLEKGGSVVITLDLKVEPKTELAAMTFDGEVWTACPEDTLTVMPNGDVEMTLTALGVYAILVNEAHVE